jgi:hypothetical protein
MAEGPGGFGEDSLGIWLIYLVVNLSLVVKRFTRLRQNLMALLNGIRPVLLPSDMLKNMRLSIRRLFPLLLVLPLLAIFLLLLQFISDLSFKWMLRMLFKW